MICYPVLSVNIARHLDPQNRLLLDKNQRTHLGAKANILVCVSIILSSRMKERERERVNEGMQKRLGVRKKYYTCGACDDTE